MNQNWNPLFTLKIHYLGKTLVYQRQCAVKYMFNLRVSTIGWVFPHYLLCIFDTYSFCGDVLFLAVDADIRVVSDHRLCNSLSGSLPP